MPKSTALAKVTQVAKRVGNFIAQPQQAKPQTRGVGASVASKDNENNFASYFQPILKRPEVQRAFTKFTETALDKLPDHKVRELIKRASPIVAKAVADYADSVASGFTYTADWTEEGEDTPQQRLLDDFITRIDVEGGGFERLITEAARGMFTHGGVFMELVIDKDRRTPVELKTLDPSTAAFKKKTDPLKGEYYDLGQRVDFKSRLTPIGQTNSKGLADRDDPNFISFNNDPTIQYRPIQSEANNPYGTPILDPAVFLVVMMAGFLTSFNDAITGHIWPNLLITIDKEKFEANLGTTVDVEELQKKLNEATETIVKAVEEMKPGDALVLGDEVKIEGQMSGQSKAPLGSIKDLQDVIRRELIVAVQSQPILMASNEAVAETHAKEQLKAYGRLIRRGQKTLNALFTDFFNLILELNGYPRLARFNLSYVNSAEYRDAAETYQIFRQASLAGSEDMIKLVEALDTAKESQYIDEVTAQEIWDHEMEIRRQLNILPEEL